MSHLKNLDKDVSESQLNDTQHLQLRLLADALSKLHSVTLQLQKEDTNLFETRTLFDGLLADFSGLNHYLGTIFGSLCHYSSFENSIFKSISEATVDLEEVSALAEFSLTLPSLHWCGYPHCQRQLNEVSVLQDTSIMTIEKN